MRTLLKCLGTVVTMVGGAALTGCECSHKPTRMDIIVTDERPGGAVLEADVAVVDADKARRLEAVEVREYFGGNHELRRELEAKGLKETVFFQGATREHSIAKGDARWKEWLGADAATDVVVLAYLPGAGPEAMKKRMTLDKCAWKGTRLVVEINATGIDCKTQPTEPK